MFTTRHCRRNVAVLASLLVTVLWMEGPAAEAASPDARQWQSGGGVNAAKKPVAAALEDVWRLPNGHVVPAVASNNQAPASNPLRGGQSVQTALREPREFVAPGNAKPLASAQNSSPVQRTAAIQNPSRSAAVKQAAATFSAGRPAMATKQPGFQSNVGLRLARAIPPNRGMINPNTARMRQRMNVATNEAEWTGGGAAEDLPLPGATPTKPLDTSDPFGADPEGYYIDGDQPYMPGRPGYCEEGCCDEGYYGDCCCGEGCEPGCGCGCGDDECCEACCNDCCAIGPGDNESCNSIRIRVPRWQELSIFGGVQGFKNPYDMDRDRGNFGFHEGFNAGFKVPYTYVGYQVGYQAAQSQLNGTENPSPGSPESHTQHFTTFGLYRRTQDGLQFGSAWDVLVDRRHNTRTFHQIRSELSWLDNCTHEFGFSATVGIMDHADEVEDNISWEAADQYLLFYRVHGKRGGEGRFYGGFSDDSDGILGADMLLPVHDRWSVQTGFTYMIPDANDGVDGSREEAWNISLALVWHWDCRARSSHTNPYRPLFNVANNGYMIIDSRDN